MSSVAREWLFAVMCMSIATGSLVCVLASIKCGGVVGVWHILPVAIYGGGIPVPPNLFQFVGGCVRICVKCLGRVVLSSGRVGEGG